MYGQELQAESYAVARMNTIIHDMDVDLQRGDTMINPKFRDAVGLARRSSTSSSPIRCGTSPSTPDIFADDPFDRFSSTAASPPARATGPGCSTRLPCLNDGGRAAVVLDTGAVTRGSGSKNEDKERNIRKWFVDHDLIEGVILLPDNLFYNTTAAGRDRRRSTSASRRPQGQDRPASTPAGASPRASRRTTSPQRRRLDLHGCTTRASRSRARSRSSTRQTSRTPTTTSARTLGRAEQRAEHARSPRSWKA